MIIEKPQPMKIGDKYYFTLSSYEPVSVEVVVPMITETDVDYALATIVAHDGGAPNNLTDEWVAEHYDGITSVDELRQTLRAQVAQMNEGYAEDSKHAKCLEELASRLVQAIPAELVEVYEDVLRAQFAEDVAAEGLSEGELLAQVGSNKAEIESVFREQAEAMAAQFAALDAFADERKLTVADDEIAKLLALPAESAEEIVQDAREHGQIEQVRTAALRNKASDVVCAECSCTYHHETPEEANKRAEEIKRFTQMREEMGQGQAGAEDGDASDSQGGFHLV